MLTCICIGCIEMWQQRRCQSDAIAIRDGWNIGLLLLLCCCCCMLLRTWWQGRQNYARDLSLFDDTVFASRLVKAHNIKEISLPNCTRFFTLLHLASTCEHLSQLHRLPCSSHNRKLSSRRVDWLELSRQKVSGVFLARARQGRTVHYGYIATGLPYGSM